MTSSKALFYAILSFVGGVFVSSFLNVPKIIIYEFFILGVFYSLVVFKNKKILVFGLCLLFLGLGILRTETAKTNSLTVEIEKSYSVPDTVNLGSEIKDFFKPLNEKMRTIIFENFSPPQSSLLLALTLGDQRYITLAWREKFSKSGTSHITAVSGLNIVILFSVLFWIGILFGLSRGRTFYFSLILAWFYIILIGFPASAVRAGIMGSVFLLAQKTGRQSGGVRALVLTAGVMLAVSPLMLKNNLGFQLSFLATLGLILASGAFKNFFDRLKILKELNLSYLLSANFSAQVFVLPVLIYNFGQVSAVSPLSNILIVPVLFLVTVLGFLFLFAGLFFSSLAALFSFPLYLVLDYMIMVINFFAGLPYSSISAKSSWLIIPAYYLAISFAFCYNRLVKICSTTSQKIWKRP